MSNARALTAVERVRNYAYQDEAIHKFIVKNCPTYMTPKQKRRVHKKNRAAHK